MKLRRSHAIVLFAALLTPTLGNIGCGDDEKGFTTTTKDGGLGNDSGSDSSTDKPDSSTPKPDSGSLDSGLPDSGSDAGNIDAGPAIYTVNAEVDGLNGDAGGFPAQGLVLRNNDGDDRQIPTDGTYPFNQQLADGAAYAVTVHQSANGRSCTVENGSGRIAAANVTVKVHCVVAATYSIGGQVRGLGGGGGGPAQGLVLRNNGGDDRPVFADGDFTFQRQLPSGGTYDVTVSTQPTGRTCNVNNGSGTVQNGDVTTVVVTCVGP